MSIDPVILFFLLGLIAGVARSDLRLPPAIYELLSILLLLAILAFAVAMIFAIVFIERGQRRGIPGPPRQGAPGQAVRRDEDRQVGVVDAHFFGGNVGERVIQGLDMRLGDLDELIIRQIGEQHVTRESEVGAVELQIEAGGDDGLVLRLHRVGEGGEGRLAQLLAGLAQDAHWAVMEISRQRLRAVPALWRRWWQLAGER